VPTIQLKTDEGAHLGYLLISGTEPLDDSNVVQRDCILTGPPPKQGETVEHPLSKAMNKHPGGEQSAKVVVSDGGIELSTDIATAGHLVISVPDKHQGSWTFSGAGGDAKGPCSLPETG